MEGYDESGQTLLRGLYADLCRGVFADHEFMQVIVPVRAIQDFVYVVIFHDDGCAGFT